MKVSKFFDRIFKVNKETIILIACAPDYISINERSRPPIHSGECVISIRKVFIALSLGSNAVCKI